MDLFLSLDTAQECHPVSTKAAGFSRHAVLSFGFAAV
jgi:hypothetical protein